MALLPASKPVWFIMTGAAALAGVGGYAWLDFHRPKVLELYVFDTPGAPSIFIRTPEDRRVLIDGGSNSDVIRRITDILPFYSRRIDMAIATHPDGKHVTGLIDVLDRYDVGKIVVPALASPIDPIYETFERAIHDRAIDRREVLAGDILSLDGQVRAEVIFPAPPDQFEYSKASAPQLLLRVVHGDNSIVTTGDATPKVQRFLTMKNHSATDVLIVSTSLSAANISGELISSFRPDYIVYSQPITATNPRSNSSAKAKADSVAGILKDRRFNIREKGGVRVVSDGKAVTIATI